MRIALVAVVLVAIPALAADFPAPAPQLKALDAQSGHWIYHGTTAFGGKPGTFTWDEHCSWSSNGLFLNCSFDNDWSGEKVQSEVVDTWNAKDQAYWHYEFYAVGDSGDKPFAAKMTIQGHTWTELGEDDDQGKKSYTRISYVYDSPSTVTVKLQVSPDQKQWKTVLDGTGTKQPR